MIKLMLRDPKTIATPEPKLRLPERWIAPKRAKYKPRTNFKRIDEMSPIGKVLVEQFLAPRKMTLTRLASELHLHSQYLSYRFRSGYLPPKLLAKVAQYFDTGEQFWIDLNRIEGKKDSRQSWALHFKSSRPGLRPNNPRDALILLMEKRNLSVSDVEAGCGLDRTTIFRHLEKGSPVSRKSAEAYGQFFATGTQYWIRLQKIVDKKKLTHKKNQA